MKQITCRQITILPARGWINNPSVHWAEHHSQGLMEQSCCLLLFPCDIPVVILTADINIMELLLFRFFYSSSLRSPEALEEQRDPVVGFFYVSVRLQTWYTDSRDYSKVNTCTVNRDSECFIRTQRAAVQMWRRKDDPGEGKAQTGKLMAHKENVYMFICV